MNLIDVFVLEAGAVFPTSELIVSFRKQYILIALQDLRSKCKSWMNVSIKKTKHLSCISHFLLFYIFLDKTYKDDPQYSSCFFFPHCILFIFCSSHLHQTCLFITTPLVQTSYWRVEHWVVEKQAHRHQAQQSLKKHSLCQLFRSHPTTGRLR